MTIIDADNLVMGRLASIVAKRLLEGDEVTIVNVEKALITGSKRDILDEHHFMRTVGGRRKGPYYPKRADRIFKRTVRGMLPYQQPRGRKALKRLKVHEGIPPKLKDEKFETIPKLSKTPKMSVRLGDVSKRYESKQ